MWSFLKKFAISRNRWIAAEQMGDCRKRRKGEAHVLLVLRPFAITSSLLIQYRSRAKIVNWSPWTFSTGKAKKWWRLCPRDLKWDANEESAEPLILQRWASIRARNVPVVFPTYSGSRVLRTRIMRTAVYSGQLGRDGIFSYWNPPYNADSRRLIRTAKEKKTGQQVRNWPCWTNITTI